MKLSELYNLIVRLGIEKDPRRKVSLHKQGAPFADTHILYGSPDIEVKRILAGIDIDVAEILLADRIRQKDALDLVIAHHPEGLAWAQFYEVMMLQVDLLEHLGISRDLANSLVEERKAEVERRVLPANHQQSVDAARLLNMPFICVHTPADNFVSDFINKLLAQKKPRKLSCLIDILSEIPEYAQAIKNNAGPRILLGQPNRSVGKIFVEMTGGTEGSKEVFSRLYKKGVRTIICMHMSEEHFKKVKDEGLNVVIAGHISSDTLGLNLLLDKIEERSGNKLEVIGCSGFTRISRNGL